jgi:vacuolar-type H+-ATPase subunit E/Vma4
MSLAAILETIERESMADADRQLQAARAEAARLAAEATAAAERRLAVALAAAEPGLRAEAARVVNAARLRQLRQRSELAAGRSDLAWAEASRRLAAIVAADGPRWHVALGALAREALATAGPDAVIAVRARDVPVVEAVAIENGARLERLPDDAPPGPLVRSADGSLEVDARLEVRLERARAAVVEA